MNEKPDTMPAGYNELTFGAPKALLIDSMEKAWRLATMVIRAKMAPAGMDTPEAICIAILHGGELGMSPFMALQRIAVINGRPTIWGDAAMSLVMNSGLLEDIDETIEGEGDRRVAICTVQRKGFKPRTSTFSVTDAKTAGLWDERATVKRKNRQTGEWFEGQNDAPWKRHPNRMLTMRARGFALRDNFADVLGGMYLREEFTGTTIEHDAQEAPAQISSGPNDPPIPPPMPPAPPEPPAPPVPRETPDSDLGPPPSEPPMAAGTTDPPEPPIPPEGYIRPNGETIETALSEYKSEALRAKSEDELDASWRQWVEPVVTYLETAVYERLVAFDDGERHRLAIEHGAEAGE